MKHIIESLNRVDERHTKDGNFAPSKRLSNIVWPSESMAYQDNFNIGKCKRAVFYKAIGATETNPMEKTGRLICDSGKMFEDYYIKRLRKTGLPVKEQQRVRFVMPNTRNKVIESGKADCIIDKSSLEIKSVGGFKSSGIFGTKYMKPLPNVDNFLQALLYEYYFNHTDEGKHLGVEDTSLVYIDRSYAKEIYFKIRINDDGYSTITVISDNDSYDIDLSNEPSLSDLASDSNKSTSNDYRKSILKVNVESIFRKSDSLYDYVKENRLPPKDFKLVYDLEDLKLGYRIGLISKSAYSKAKSGDSFGDKQCKWCNYRDKCLKDSGIS